MTRAAVLIETDQLLWPGFASINPNYYGLDRLAAMGPVNMPSHLSLLKRLWSQMLKKSSAASLAPPQSVESVS